jgi:hypothetical protein
MFPVVTADSKGVPMAQITSQFLWELVEHLSAQRLDVHYSYRDPHFEARFPRMTVAAVQRTIDEWAHVHPRLAA